MAGNRSPGARLALAIVAVVAAILVAVGGLLYWGLTENSGEARFATLPIPTSQVVHLPAGRVDFTFTMDLSNQTVAIPLLQVQVRPVGGGGPAPVAMHVGAPNSVNGVTHVQVGRADVPRAGDYRVSVDGDVSASPGPELRLGVRIDHWPVVLGALAAAGVLVLAVAIPAFVSFSRALRRNRESRLFGTSGSGPLPSR